jgi:hypothetical protein
MVKVRKSLEQIWIGPGDSRRMRFTGFKTALEGDKVVSPKFRLPLSSR